MTLTRHRFQSRASAARRPSRMGLIMQSAEASSNGWAQRGPRNLHVYGEGRGRDLARRLYDTGQFTITLTGYNNVPPVTASAPRSRRSDLAEHHNCWCFPDRIAPPSRLKPRLRNRPRFTFDGLLNSSGVLNIDWAEYATGVREVISVTDDGAADGDARTLEARRLRRPQGNNDVDTKRQLSPTRYTPVWRSTITAYVERIR